VDSVSIFARGFGLSHSVPSPNVDFDNTCQADDSFAVLEMICSSCSSISLKVKGQRRRSVLAYTIFHVSDEH